MSGTPGELDQAEPSVIMLLQQDLISSCAFSTRTKLGHYADSMCFSSESPSGGCPVPPWIPARLAALLPADERCMTHLCPGLGTGAVARWAAGGCVAVAMPAWTFRAYAALHELSVIRRTLDFSQSQRQSGTQLSTTPHHHSSQVCGCSTFEAALIPGTPALRWRLAPRSTLAQRHAICQAHMTHALLLQPWVCA